MAHYLMQRLYVHFQTNFSSWVPKGGQVKKLLRVSTSAGSIVFSSKDKDAITLFFTTFFLW